MEKNIIEVSGVKFKKFLSERKIRILVKKLSKAINKDYADKKTLILPVLNGSYIFASDLTRLLKIDFVLEFVKLSSYLGTKSTGELNRIIGVPDIPEKLSSYDVLVLEDIIDSGFTAKELVKELKLKGVKSVKVSSLLFKPHSCKENLNVDYYGLAVDDDFLIGYGMDYNGKARNLKSIYKKIN